MQKVKQFWREHWAFVFCMALMFVFRSPVADWNHVPSGSMQPTIKEGDRILINKLAYDVQLPFTGHSLVKLADPQRGDVVIFESAAANNRLVKRVIGMPGDWVEMQDNQLRINGQALLYQAEQGTDWQENLLGVKHEIRLTQQDSGLSSFEPLRIPAGFYLVLGDNRNNSADSRVIGLVPRQEIIGKGEMVVMSFNPDNYYLPRGDRFFVAL